MRFRLTCICVLSYLYFIIKTITVMKTFRQNIGTVETTGETRNLGHGLQLEVVYNDGTKGWEHVEDLEIPAAIKNCVDLYHDDEDFESNLGSTLHENLSVNGIHAEDEVEFEEFKNIARKLI
jgi:hypothetical protein